MSAPRILDLFSCAGGAAMGYHRAGFDVYGVDIVPQPHYPFPFHQGDALDVLARLLRGEAIGFTHTDGHVEYLSLSDFDAVHASPPCQASSALTKGTNRGKEYPQLIPATRAALEALQLPYVIENVQGSDLRRDMVLCGEMFGLGVLRHRYFEVGNWSAVAPAHVRHRGRVRGYRHGEWFDGPYFAVYGNGGGKGSLLQWAEAMGIHWMHEKAELSEAIPPAYTEWIGSQLIAQLAVAA